LSGPSLFPPASVVHNLLPSAEPVVLVRDHLKMPITPWEGALFTTNYRDRAWPVTTSIDSMRNG
jgi:hypothetical protein